MIYFDVLFSLERSSAGYSEGSSRKKSRITHCWHEQILPRLGTIVCESTVNCPELYQFNETTFGKYDIFEYNKSREKKSRKKEGCSGNGLKLSESNAILECKYIFFLRNLNSLNLMIRSSERKLKMPLTNCLSNSKISIIENVHLLL